MSSVSLALRRPADPYRENLGARDTAALVRQVLGLRRRMHLEQGVVLCQLPFWWPLAKALRDELGWPVVYDRMDMHRGFAATDERAVARREGPGRERRPRLGRVEGAGGGVVPARVASS